MTGGRHGKNVPEASGADGRDGSQPLTGLNIVIVGDCSKDEIGVAVCDGVPDTLKRFGLVNKQDLLDSNFFLPKTCTYLNVGQTIGIVRVQHNQVSNLQLIVQESHQRHSVPVGRRNDSPKQGKG